MRDAWIVFIAGAVGALAGGGATIIGSGLNLRGQSVELERVGS